MFSYLIEMEIPNDRSGTISLLCCNRHKVQFASSANGPNGKASPNPQDAENGIAFPVYISPIGRNKPPANQRWVRSPALASRTEGKRGGKNTLAQACAYTSPPRMSPWEVPCSTGLARGPTE